MRSPNELLRELQRLNKTGVINDEEYLVLKKIIAGGRISPELYRRFDQLFAGNSKKTIPVENEKRSVPKVEKTSEKDDRLYSMAEAINELNLKLTKGGRFDHSRELLNCPACELFEDVNNNGMLITAEPVDPEVDTGLRFVKVRDGEWECPDCGHICRENGKKPRRP